MAFRDFGKGVLTNPNGGGDEWDDRLRKKGETEETLGDADG